MRSMKLFLYKTRHAYGQGIDSNTEFSTIFLNELILQEKLYFTNEIKFLPILIEQLFQRA